MPKFTVIGLYIDQDPPQRYAQAFEAETAEEAEDLCLETYFGNDEFDLAIAGVIAGDVEVVA